MSQIFLYIHVPIRSVFVGRLFSHYLHSGAGSSAKQFHLDVQNAISRWKECVSKNTQRHCVYDSDFKKSVKVSYVRKCYNNPKCWYRHAKANSVDPDQMPQNAPSDQGLHCWPLIQ